MLVKNNTYGYSRNKRHITGRGFVDTMSSIFNSLKTSVAPAFRSVGTYVSANRDLIAKPLLGAVGSLAATGLTAGVPALLNHIVNRNRSRGSEPQIPNDPKYKEILQSLMTPPRDTTAAGVGVGPPVSNIIGSRIKPRGRRSRSYSGACIKTF